MWRLLEGARVTWDEEHRWGLIVERRCGVASQIGKGAGKVKVDICQMRC